MSRWVVSADLGQAMDPTAIGVLEVSTRQDAVNAQYLDPPGELAKAVTLRWWEDQHGKFRDGGPQYPRHAVRMDVRHLERLPLRMNYVDQVAYIGSLLRRPRLSGASFVIDMTGCGRPVCDLFKRAGLRPIGVTITGGNAETKEWVNGAEEWKVSKGLLVSHLQASLHEGTLRINRQLTEAQALAIELQDFRANISETGYARYGAREGAHDDLVLSVCLGAWWASREHGYAITTTYQLVP
jgi:hypothetical protein